MTEFLWAPELDHFKCWHLCALTQNWALVDLVLIQIKVAHPVVCFELTAAFKSPNAAASQVNRLGHQKVWTPRWPFSLRRLVAVA